MLIDTDDLVTAGGIAELADVVPSAVSNWIKRYDDFPTPIWTVGKIKFFDREQVEHWIDTHPMWGGQRDDVDPYVWP